MVGLGAPQQTRPGRDHRRCRLCTGEAAVACALSICAEVCRTRGLRAAFERPRFRRAWRSGRRLSAGGREGVAGQEWA